MASVFDQIKEVFEAIIKADLEPTTTLEFLKLDELDLCQLVIDLEDQFKIDIDDESALKFKTVADIETFISEAISKKG
jgi:acyl carrier protein